MGPNRVRTSMKRGTPPITHNFWAYGTVESDPHTYTLSLKILSRSKSQFKKNTFLIRNINTIVFYLLIKKS